MATINLNLSHEEFLLFNDFAKMKKTTIENLLKKTLFEKIEAEYDEKIGNEALIEFRTNPYTFTVNELQDKYNL